MSKRIEGYDFIRSLMILIVFIGHILQSEGSETAKIMALSLSPGLTMSLLGFISGALLSARVSDTGAFLIRRLTRIYLSLIPCLCLILIIHMFIGKLPIDSLLRPSERIFVRHTFIHLTGLSAFLGIFGVENKATIGGGLWFITVIIAMYFALPIFQKLFRHHRGFIHLIAVMIACMALQLVGLGVGSASNVIISFSLGVYLVVNGKLEHLIQSGALRNIFYSVALLAIVVLAQAELLPSRIQVFLYVFYPLAFVPLMFAVSKRLPAPVLAASGFFASLSYEFYILHFYFIGDNFRDFFPAAVPLYVHITISFVVSLILAFVMSRCASWLQKMTDGYLLEA